METVSVFEHLTIAFQNGCIYLFNFLFLFLEGSLQSALIYQLVHTDRRNLLWQSPALTFGNSLGNFCQETAQERWNDIEHHLT